MIHGRYGLYTQGCRCDECRAAAAEYHQVQRENRKSDPFEPAQENVITARVAEVFAPSDAQRKADLDELVFRKSRCRYCRRELSDASLMAHPGVCARRKCLSRARGEVLSALPIKMAMSAKATQDKADRYLVARANLAPSRRRGEPCPTCGSRGTRHKGGCSESWSQRSASAA